MVRWQQRVLTNKANYKSGDTAEPAIESPEVKMTVSVNVAGFCVGLSGAVDKVRPVSSVTTAAAGTLAGELR